ncbi:MAG: MBL fold metallo-hydrolase, partial [Bacilli bacterium]
MKLETLVLGSLDNNCYILTKDKFALVIDPSCEVNKILKAIGKKELLGILVTHHHQDHIGALQELIENTKAEVYNFDAGYQHIGPFNFEVIETKGHTEDSKTFYFKDENFMFTGDFLFKESIGRTDFMGGSMKEMLKSIELIKKYDDCLVYPGHGPSTTLEYEKQNNGFF